MKTAGRVAVAPLGLPSAVAMETVGRDAIFVVSTGVRVVDVVVIQGLKIEAHQVRVRNFSPSVGLVGSRNALNPDYYFELRLPREAHCVLACIM